MLNFFTDPHIGLGARTNTSSNSSKSLDLKLNLVSDQIVRQYSNLICAGDLFHRSHNREDVIEHGIRIANGCDIVLSGNHDETNRADDRSSMDIVASVCDSVLGSNQKVQIYPDLEFDSGEKVTVVPHHISQEMFDKAVEEACKYKGDIIVLHCNFNNPLTDGIDTALNLTIEQSEALLECYSYIVIGHEHNTRWEMNGRLLALGNVHPTNFGDISDKFVWHFDKSAEQPWTKTKIWDKATGYINLSAQDIFDLPEEEFFVEEGTEPPGFVDIIGELPAEDMPALAHRIGLIWKHWSPYMVRNQVNSVTEKTESLMEEGYQIEDFSKKIVEGLKESPELLEKFNAELAKVGE